MEHIGGIDLVWEGIGKDSWEMIEQGANELVSTGDMYDVGSKLLEVISNKERTWLDAENLVTEFWNATTPKTMTDQEIFDRVQSTSSLQDGDLVTTGTIWNEDTQKWD